MQPVHHLASPFPVKRTLDLLPVAYPERCSRNSEMSPVKTAIVPGNGAGNVLRREAHHARERLSHFGGCVLALPITRCCTCASAQVQLVRMAQDAAAPPAGYELRLQVRAANPTRATHTQSAAGECGMRPLPCSHDQEHAGPCASQGAHMAALHAR